MDSENCMDYELLKSLILFLSKEIGMEPSSIDLGIIADELKPKKLVLSHILFWGASEESLINDVKKNFNGETIIANDLMVIE